jgi:multidrug efflux system membrane fusion protein
MSVPVQDSKPQLGQKSGSGWISWLVVLALMGGGGWYYYKNFWNAPAAASTSGKKGGKNKGSGAVPVVLASVSRGDMPVYLRGLGSVLAFNTVTVHSRVDGQLMNVGFKEGQFVKEGDLLAVIDPRPYEVMLEQAEGQLAHDKAALSDLQLNYERFKSLYKDGVIPKQQLDTQLSQVGTFEGSIKSDQGQIDNAKLQLVYCKINSPITGRVGLRLVDPGNIVHAADATGMLVITQMQPIAVTYNLPQDSLPVVYKKLRNGEELVVEAFDSSNTNKIATGKLLTIDNQIDPTTGTYKLKAQFPNEDHALFPNQFVNVRMRVDTEHGLTITPAAAIQRGPAGNYVFLAEDKKAKVHPVTVAITEGETVGVSNGLSVGDMVVVDGIDKLEDGTSITDTGVKRGDKSGKGGGKDGGKDGGGKDGGSGGSGGSGGKHGGAHAE